MVASISAFHGCNLLSHKFASCGMHSDLHIANSTANLTRRNWCFKTRATEDTKESHQHDEDLSLSWLLAPEEKSVLPIKPLQKERTLHKNSFGVILEWKGVVVEEDDPELEPSVWYILSLEEEKTFLSDHMLREIEGMKTEQAISEVLKWSNDPNEVQIIASRKEFIYNTLSRRPYRVRPGTQQFLSMVIKYDVPIALVSNLSRSSLEEAVDPIGLKDRFDAMVSVQDVERGKPEPDLYELAAQQIGICPERCVVIGNTDLMTEAAHRAGMSCVAVASLQPVYELGAADHVVRWLDEVSFRELQTLADGDPIGARALANSMEMETVVEE